jgi:hypothetical protein
MHWDSPSTVVTNQNNDDRRSGSSPGAGMRSPDRRNNRTEKPADQNAEDSFNEAQQARDFDTPTPFGRRRSDRKVSSPIENTPAANDETVNFYPERLPEQTVVFNENSHNRLSFNMSNPLSMRLKSDHTISFTNTRQLRFSSGSHLDFRPNGPSSKEAEVIISSAVQQLSETCRLNNAVVQRAGKELKRVQLETLRDDRWAVVLTYELGDNGSVRYEPLPTGGVKSMKIDLPLLLAQDMVQNDLSLNWESYCKKFLAGKRLSA